MAEAGLADLFSGASPSPPRPPRSPTPRSPSPVHRESLFLSPSDTPIRTRRSSIPVPSPPTHPSFQPPRTNAAEAVSVENFDDVVFDAGYDPLDLSAAYGEADEARGLGEDEPPGKKRRVMAKVDVDRLMGDNGFPALMKAAKRFKPRGKGKEEKDLRDLLNVYQLWAHGMFPKGDFEGTIKRVETICRSRRMEIAMQGYRDAFYPPLDSPAQQLARSPSHTDADIPLHEASAAGNEAEPVLIGDAERHGASDRGSSQPLFDRREDEEEDDGPDFDELLAMEEMEREQAAEPSLQDTRDARIKAIQRGGEGIAQPSDRAAKNGDEPPSPLAEEDEWDGLYN